MPLEIWTRLFFSLIRYCGGVVKSIRFPPCKQGHWKYRKSLFKPHLTELNQGSESARQSDPSLSDQGCSEGRRCILINKSPSPCVSDLNPALLMCFYHLSCLGEISLPAPQTWPSYISSGTLSPLCSAQRERAPETHSPIWNGSFLPRESVCGTHLHARRGVRTHHCGTQVSRFDESEALASDSIVCCWVELGTEREVMSADRTTWRCTSFSHFSVGREKPQCVTFLSLYIYIHIYLHMYIYIRRLDGVHMKHRPSDMATKNLQDRGLYVDIFVALSSHSSITVSP